MNPKKILLIKPLSLFCLLIFSTHAWSDGNQLHIRGGMVKGSYSGPLEASFMVIPAIELEMELFQSARTSTHIKTSFAMDISKAKVFYSGVSAGQRFYFGAPGMMFDRIEGSHSLVAYPRHRYYAGYEVGVAQVLLDEFTPALNIVGSVIEMATFGGYIYQLTKSVGLDFNVGAGFGVGFTTVAVNGMSIKASLGLSYFF